MRIGAPVRSTTESTTCSLHPRRKCC
ncbi:unnamed protein product [Acanthoscelides obtectus]|uniref:Uncharacterized protein n=1 Tax=Acanthoscelides obtectus TaxID=200917 RepID=A0A9P0P1J8_ACAOB|nr:unnamed protein product [Acanthoscelides obtectus]CAK1648087.1 hypothetical protein AOBTE_LOCUS15535 [Acanthoscelides obtectus]